MPKVSVIVPVYGVEKYIEKCVRSLFEQTLDAIEYLFIDDCTPDRSIEILKSVLEEYPNRKSQVSIHQMEQNSGQAAVRRWGILNATGEYIIHCDSDDWVDKNLYKNLYQCAKEQGADIVFCDYWKSSENGLSECHRRISYNKEILLSWMLIGRTDSNFLGGALVHNKIAHDNRILYPRYNFGEDRTLIFQYVYLSEEFVMLPECLYYYRYNPVSICHSSDMDSYRRKSRIENFNVILRFIDNNESQLELTDAIELEKFRMNRNGQSEGSKIMRMPLSLLFNKWFWKKIQWRWGF